MMKPSAIVLALSILLSLIPTANAALTATLDRNEVDSGETVELVLEHDGNSGEADLGPLRKDFDILGSSTSSSIQIINGQFSSHREMHVTLSPKHTGTLEIPSLSWGADHSPPLNLTVNGGGATGSGTAGSGGGTQSTAAPASSLSRVFITTAVDQARPYVQSAVMLTVQIHADLALYQASLDFTGNSDVLAQQIGKDRESKETRGGRSFRLIERDYLLTPQRSGTLKLDGPVLDAQVADANNVNPFGPNSPLANAFGNLPFGNMMNTYRPLRLRGEPVELEVRPRPPGAGGDWLPARNLTLDASWRPDSLSVHAGDPVTLHVRITAEGQAAAQLPDLSSLLKLPDGLKAYPDQPKLEDSEGQRGDWSGIVGRREQDIALIAGTPGRYEIPALHLAWWDTHEDVQREVTLPARTIEVLPVSGATALPPAPPAAASAPEPAPASATPLATAEAAAAPASTRSPWFWSTLALAPLWLATLFAWWRRHARTTSVDERRAITTEPVRLDESRRMFRDACRRNDAPAARRSLLDWASAADPGHPFRGLNALAATVEPQVAELVRGLDRACYTGAQWQGEALAAALKELPRQRSVKATAELLPGLYPESVSHRTD